MAEIAKLVLLLLAVLLGVTAIIVDVKKRGDHAERQERANVLFGEVCLISERPIECWLPDEYRVELTFYRNMTSEECRILEKIADQLGADRIEVNTHCYTVCYDSHQVRQQSDRFDMIWGGAGSYEEAATAIERLKNKIESCKNGGRHA